MVNYSVVAALEKKGLIVIASVSDAGYDAVFQLKKGA
jgi:hypothetical protein